MSENSFLLSPLNIGIEGAEKTSPVIAFNGNDGNTESGINFNQRLNMTSAQIYIDGVSFRMKIPPEVTNEFTIISDNSGNGTFAHHRISNDKSEIIILGSIEIPFKLNDGEWHYYEIVKNSNTFNYAVYVDGVKYTTTTGISAARYMDSFGVGQPSVSGAYGGVEVKGITWIYNSEIIMSLPLEEGTGNTLSNEFGTDGSIVGIDVDWAGSKLPSKTHSYLKFTNTSSYNYIKTTEPIDIVGADGGALEFDYFVETIGVNNVILCADGADASNTVSVLYYTSAQPNTLRFVNSSGVTRTLSVTTNLGDGSVHNIKLSPEGSSAIRIHIDGDDEGVFSSIPLDDIRAFGGRQGTIISSSENWGVRNIKYTKNDVVIIDAPCNDGNGRLIMNQSDSLKPLIVSSDDYPWELPPQPVPEILYSPAFSGFSTQSENYAKIPYYSSSNGAKVSFKFKSKSDLSSSSYRMILDGHPLSGDTGGLGRAYIFANLGQIDQNGFTSLRVNGGTDYSVVSGVIYEVEAVLNDGVCINSIRTGASNEKLDGLIYDLKFYDPQDASNSRFYPVLEYRPEGETSGTNLPCYDANGNELPPLNGTLINFPVGAEWVPAGEIPEPEEQPPIVTKSPESATVAVGIPHTFTAGFSGANVTAQWIKNGLDIPNQNQLSYTLIPNSSMQGDQFSCSGRNEGGSVVTELATLTLRPRIYMNWDLTMFTQWATDKISLRFNADGTINYFSDQGQQNEEWCSSATDPALNFNISDYEVRLVTLKGEATVDSTSDITFAATAMTDGITLVIDISQCPTEESRSFSVQVTDKTMPGYNWAGWNSDVLYYKRLP